MQELDPTRCLKAALANHSQASALTNSKHISEASLVLEKSISIRGISASVKTQVERLAAASLFFSRDNRMPKFSMLEST